MKQPIIDFLKSYIQDRPAILGLSGGVDSAVVLKLLTEVLPKDQIHTYHLPSNSNSAEDLADCQQLVELFGVHFDNISIDDIIASYQAANPELTRIALGNLKSRIRMTMLYARANLLNGLVIGTGNKTELQLGYFTKYGDGAVDLLPIAHLYKTEVWQLAKELELPEQFITKAPSAGLWTGQTDEAELGVTYVVADKILQAINQQQSLDAFNLADVQRIQQLQRAAVHKQALPPHL